MSRWDLPEGHQEKDKEDREVPPQRKMPDFIYVDTDRESSQRGYEEFTEQFSESFAEIKTKEYPLFARVICFFSAFFLLLFAVLGLLFLIVFLLINLLTGFRLTSFWNQTKKMWEGIKKMGVMMVGLAIAVFSPVLGFSVMITYFLMRGQNMDDQFVTRIMRSHFEHH